MSKKIIFYQNTATHTNLIFF